MQPFKLHERIEADTHFICDLPLCSVLLMKDRRFPWLLLVPKRAEISEIYDLSPDDQRVMLDEISRASRALKSGFKADKINIAALGNVVPQLHIHVVARFFNDAAWPKVVWGFGESSPYSPEELESVTAKIKNLLGGEGGKS